MIGCADGAEMLREMHRSLIECGSRVRRDRHRQYPFLQVDQDQRAGFCVQLHGKRRRKKD
jgi:hypothetical protein